MATEISNSRINPLFWFGFIFVIATSDLNGTSTRYGIYLTAIMLVIMFVLAIILRQHEKILIKNNIIHLQLVDLEAKVELTEDSFCKFPKSYTEMFISTPKAKLTVKTYRFKKKKLVKFLSENNLYNQ